MSSTITNLKVRFHELALVVTSLLVLTACGSTTARESLTTGAGSSLSGSQTGLTTTPTPSGNIYNLPDADSYVAQLNGASGAVQTVTYNIQTSRTLKVKVTPMGAPNLTLPGYTNWSFPYGCLRLRVTVNGVTKVTGVLRVDGVSQGATSVCANAPTYQVLDFTNSVTGNGTTAVTVSNPEYDNCRYTWPLNYGCQMSAIFQNHIIASSIQIQGDNTWMDL
jgi:hypothetical protein